MWSNMMKLGKADIGKNRTGCIESLEVLPVLALFNLEKSNAIARGKSDP